MRHFFLAVLIWCLLAEAPTYAYLDPGSGSMLLQVLLGGFAAVGVILRVYWTRVMEWFRPKDVNNPPTDSASPS